MIVATYMHTASTRNGNSRSGWAIHQLREISDPFSDGTRVRYVGWVDAGAAGRSALKYAYPQAIEVQTIEVTPRAYRAARDAEPENDCSCAGCTESDTAAEWYACVCGSEFRSPHERDDHISRNGCLLIKTS